MTRFASNGATVTRSTYLGGGDYDSGSGVAIDGDDNVYLVGSTVGNRFPASAGAFQTEDQGPGDGGEAIVAKFTPTLDATTYATYLGGSSLDTAAAVRVDGTGNAHVVGTTFSPTFPATGDAYQPDPGPDDGVVASGSRTASTPSSTATAPTSSTPPSWAARAPTPPTV